MPLKTPFHNCIAQYNETEIWKTWSGYLVPSSLQHCTATEYYSIRNAVSILDTSPLFKYQFQGPDAVELLSNSMVRDVRKCKVGKAQYTIWCDAHGYVVQDGVLLRLEEDKFLLTAGERTLRWFRQIAKENNLSQAVVKDVSTDYGILALQGPHSHSVLRSLTPEPTRLGYFGVCQAQIDNHDVIISRTGFTGDLGYEIWVKRENAERVFRALMEAGAGYNITPIGTTALKMSRVEAGLLLMDVDFYSSRFAWSLAQKETPIELGMSWMLNNLQDDDRNFVGRCAIEKEVAETSSRWTTVGLGIDVQQYERKFQDCGVIPEKHNVYCEGTRSLYRCNDQPWDYAGYVSSFLYSSLLKRPIALGKVPMDHAAVGSKLKMELQVIRKPEVVEATVERTPFYNPERKTELFKTEDV